MTKEELQKHLFTGQTHVYAVLDGASINGLRQKLFETDPPSFCLFRGELPPDVAETAPYLVGLLAGSPFTDWLLGECYGKHWGIFAQSRKSIRDMRQHFRGLVTVYDESGKPMIFRFYDPRVLNTYLPSCNDSELTSFFGNVDALFAETARKGMSKFTLESKALKEVNLESA